VNFWTYQYLWYFQLYSSACIITLVAHLKSTEHLRQGKLEEANQMLRDSQEELRQHRDHLEELVEERTKDLVVANQQLVLDQESRDGYN
jgi:F0F1-type ATP synthase membrane subunit b/b'